MGLNETPSANRVHISIFGKRNAGKSSVMNAIINQDLAIVSDVKGTTTDPVYKSMELLPIGPIMMIDTPGLDDIGELGEKRIKKTYGVLNKSNIAIIVVDAKEGVSDVELSLIELVKSKELPYLIVYNKIDLYEKQENIDDNSIYVSAKTKHNINELKERISKLVNTGDMTLKIVGDILEPDEIAVLVVPIDTAAPKGRLILPQQQTIRDILEADAVSVVVKESQFLKTLENLAKKPKIVITDSQVFERVKKETPKDIYLTSFSILMARYKGVLKTAVNGAKSIENLKNGDKILISEGCTHHRQCDDIGTVKLPKWIKEYTKCDIKFEFTSGTHFPDNLDEYKLVVHCGGCMLNDKEMKHRQKSTTDKVIPYTNYGILIAYINGILERCIKMFPDIN